MIDFVLVLANKGLIGFVGLAMIILGITSLLLMIVVTRKRYLEYMDTKFQGFYVDYGLMFNSQRAGIYGLVLTYPSLLAGETYKSVDFESISKSMKALYLTYFWSLIVFILLMVLFVYMGSNNIGY